ncbi:MAG: SIS domain-containing protein [Verrucomicrobia bacterium]|nr:SIS domain-containing protein [Verrucomicrobiota bacterium]
MSDPKNVYLDQVHQAARSVDPAAVDACMDCLESAYREGRGVYVIGNGGSASNATHFAQDLSKGAMPDLEKGRRFRVLSLTDNLAYLTAVGNDMGYDRVFEQQLRPFAQRGELLVAISGSGNSPSILRAVAYAKEVGLTVIAFTGFDGGKLLPMADIRVHVPLKDMCQAEAVHSIYFHMIVDLLRARFARA